MEHRATFGKSNIRYSKITLKKRQQLVKEVLENNQLVSKIAKRLHLSLSTAKLIIKRYKEEGTFFESRAEKAKRIRKEQNTETALIEQQGPVIRQQTENMTATILPDANTSVISIPQPIYYTNYWTQMHPFVYPTFQGMMFYQL